MVAICRPTDSGIKGIEDTAFIQCINGQEPQIHELWCLGLDVIYQEVHPTALVDVPAGTVRDFVTDCLAENRRRILIIRQLYIKDSVQFLGLSDQSRGSGFSPPGSS